MGHKKVVNRKKLIKKERRCSKGSSKVLNNVFPDLERVFQKYFHYRLSKDLYRGDISIVPAEDFYLCSYLRFLEDFENYSKSEQGLEYYTRENALRYLGKVVEFRGIISGLRQFKSGYKILLRSPEVVKVISDSVDEYNAVFNDGTEEEYKSMVKNARMVEDSVLVDSHIWLDVSKIDFILLTSSLSGVQGVFNLLVGSTIEFYCVLETYRGKVENGEVGDKVGFKDDVWLTNCYTPCFGYSSIDYKLIEDSYTSQKYRVISGDNAGLMRGYQVLGRDFALGGISFKKDRLDNGEFGVARVGSSFIRYKDSEPNSFISKVFSSDLQDDASLERLFMEERRRVLWSYSKEYSIFFRLNRRFIDGEYGWLITDKTKYNVWRSHAKRRRELESKDVVFIHG